jgi:hypothetical protein
MMLTRHRNNRLPTSSCYTSVFDKCEDDFEQDRGVLNGSVSGSCDAKISSMLQALGSCTRIKHTPMPFAYIVHLRHVALSSQPFPRCQCQQGVPFEP